MGLLHVHTDVLDNGLNELNNVDTALIIKGYALNDSYATVTGPTVKVAEVAITGPDMSVTTLNTYDRKWTVNAKSGLNALIDTDQQTDDLHIAYVDSVTSRVLYVTDEITDQYVTTGNPINLPAGEYQSFQPVEAV